MGPVELLKNRDAKVRIKMIDSTNSIASLSNQRKSELHPLQRPIPFVFLLFLMAGAFFIHRSRNSVDKSAHTMATGMSAAEQNDWASRFVPEPVAFDIEARDGIKIISPAEGLSAKPPDISAFEPASAADAADFRANLGDEWRHLPASAVRKTRIRRIILCSNLQVLGHPVGGYADVRNGDLYFDVRFPELAGPDLRRLIQHEFFHMLDAVDDDQGLLDPAWARLNAADFQYDTNRKFTSVNSSLLSAPEGFVSQYATSEVQEDKAEMFANMIVNPARVASRAKTDRVLNAKRQRMMKLIRTFCPEMDDSFWDRMAKVPRHL